MSLHQEAQSPAETELQAIYLLLTKDTHVILIPSALEKEMHQIIVNTEEGTVLTCNINFNAVSYLQYDILAKRSLVFS